MGSAVILDLMGGVALLLWGLHMVHSGVVRAFGADLRRLLGVALQNRFRAFLAGAFVTALLQSSTATGLMAASFVTGGTRGSRAGARGHARCQCRYHTRRSSSVLRHRIADAYFVDDRRDRFQARRPNAHSRSGPGSDRDWPDAAGAAYFSRRSHDDGELYRRARPARRHRESAAPVSAARSSHDLGGSLEHRRGSRRDVARRRPARLPDGGARHGTRRERRQRAQPSDRGQSAAKSGQPATARSAIFSLAWPVAPSYSRFCSPLQMCCSSSSRAPRASPRISTPPSTCCSPSFSSAR